MLVLLIRIVFIGIKTGFVTELFKLFGVLCAAFVGLHYYSSLAVFFVKKLKWSSEWLECVFFVLLVSLVVLVIKFLRDGFFMLFKFETTHAGVNQWGSGVLAILRAVFLASLIMYGLLLTRVEYFQKLTLKSVSQKLILKTAPHTYSFLFHQLIGKIFIQEKFNNEVFMITSSNSVSRRSL